MMDWPDHSERPRLAGVNCFGISGTNAHLLVEEYRPPEETGRVRGMAGSARAVTSRPSRVLPLSGKVEAALQELAGRYLTWLDERAAELASRGEASDPLLSDMAWTAGVGRSHFDHRAAIVFHDVGSLRERVEGGGGAGRRRRCPNSRGQGGLFAYTGQGSQWTGMGRTLYENEPVARSVMDRCEAVFREERGASLLDVMFGLAGGEQGDLGDTAWEQPALYTLECALTALWASVGRAARGGVGAQRRRDCRGPGGRRVQSGRRDAIRVCTGEP